VGAHHREWPAPMKHRLPIYEFRPGVIMW
jgi:hypothetical protein